MPKIVSFMLSAITNNVPNASGGTVQQLTGPMIVLRPRYIPGEYSFAITLGINDLDLSVDNKLQLAITSPSGSTVFEVKDGVLQAVGVDSVLPKAVQGFVMTLPLQNIEFKEEGIYHLSVSLNGDKLGVQDIPVYQAGDNK